jgi:hypothetical protein
MIAGGMNAVERGVCGTSIVLLDDLPVVHPGLLPPVLTVDAARSVRHQP